MFNIPTVNIKATGENIIRLRKQAGLSVKDIQAVCGFSTSQAIYKWQQGIDANISVNEVKKLNESYEAVTVTPEGGNIGVNIGVDKFYDAYENGISYDAVVDRAAEVVSVGLAQRPDIDVASLTNYSQMNSFIPLPS